MSVTTKENYSLNNLSPEKMELLRRTICAGASNDELELFFHACNTTGLDPFMRQIYLLKMGGKMVPVTGIDGYRVIAERTGKYSPGRETTYVYDDKKGLFSATSYVKKLAADGTWHEVAATAIYSEYAGQTPIWKKMPYLMLAKCSESLALRRAFPANLSGIYTEDEMDQAKEAPGNATTEQAKEASANSTNEPKALPSFISIDEAKYLDSLLHEEDKEYKERLYKWANIKDFTELSSEKFEAVKKSILNRIAERTKKPQTT